MDVIQNFNDELQSLLDMKPPVSKAKMGLITRAAMKGVKFYKHIVQSVEKFILKCRPEYKIPGLYVIDSIVRQSRHQFGPERDVYAARFSRNLPVTFNHLFSSCPPDDKPKVVRVLNLWQKNGVFESQIILPLLDMANPNSANILTESSLSTDSPDNLDQIKNQTSKFHQFNNTKGTSQHQKNPSGRHHRCDDSKLKFSKNMLDFDYDEDDEDDDDNGDETPTEAEPPLSSTLNKIEMEQRSRNDIQPPQNHTSQRAHQSSSGAIPEQDPVLERWNRLIRQQSITSDTSTDLSSGDIRSSRARSRSPVPREKPASPKIVIPPKPAAKIIVTENTSERDVERKAERLRKCLPEIRDKHLTVCSSTLWLGHVPKTVSEADISDAFGEYGSITSIDLIPPRGCAYVCMDRRQDAKRALVESKDLKLNGSHIKLAWAPGKGFKEYRKLKDFWEVSIGVSYIPYAKIDSSIDFDILEEGGVIDEDSMTIEMKEMRERKSKEKEEKEKVTQPVVNLPLPTLPILSQPPPPFTIPPNLNIPPPTALGQNTALGGIPFPPPLVTSSSNQISQINQSVFDHNDSQDCDNADASKTPNSIEQQLSITERQINMVEQQLSMMQQAQTINQAQTHRQHMQPQAIFPQGLNPMIFDLPPHLMSGHQMLDPHTQQMSIYANPTQQILAQPPPILPISQPGMNPNMSGGGMPNYRY